MRKTQLPVTDDPWAIEETPPPPAACEFCRRSVTAIVATGRGASREFNYSYQLDTWCCLRCLDRLTSKKTKRPPSFVTSQQSSEVPKVSREVRDVSLEVDGGGGVVGRA